MEMEAPKFDLSPHACKRARLLMMGAAVAVHRGREGADLYAAEPTWSFRQTRTCTCPLDKAGSNQKLWALESGSHFGMSRLTGSRKKTTRVTRRSAPDSSLAARTSPRWPKRMSNVTSGQPQRHPPWCICSNEEAMPPKTNARSRLKR